MPTIPVTLTIHPLAQELHPFIRPVGAAPAVQWGYDYDWELLFEKFAESAAEGGWTPGAHYSFSYWNDGSSPEEIFGRDPADYPLGEITFELDDAIPTGYDYDTPDEDWPTLAGTITYPDDEGWFGADIRLYLATDAVDVRNLLGTNYHVRRIYEVQITSPIGRWMGYSSTQTYAADLSLSNGITTADRYPYGGADARRFLTVGRAGSIALRPGGPFIDSRAFTTVFEFGEDGATATEGTLDADGVELLRVDFAAADGVDNVPQATNGPRVRLVDENGMSSAWIYAYFDPEAIITAPDEAEEDETVTLDGIASCDLDGWLTLYEWSVYQTVLDDDHLMATATGETLELDFEPGTYFIRLVVTDNRGVRSPAATHTLTVVDNVSRVAIVHHPAGYTLTAARTVEGESAEKTLRVARQSAGIETREVLAEFAGEKSPALFLTGGQVQGLKRSGPLHLASIAGDGTGTLRFSGDEGESWETMVTIYGGGLGTLKAQDVCDTVEGGAAAALVVKNGADYRLYFKYTPDPENWPDDADAVLVTGTLPNGGAFGIRQRPEDTAIVLSNGAALEFVTNDYGESF